MRKTQTLYFTLFAFVVIISLFSCKVNRNLMFKTPDDFKFDQANLDSTNRSYRIGPNDYITMEIYTNQGSLIVQYTTSSTDFARVVSSPSLFYTVDQNGDCELPVLGKVHLAGMTIAEAQSFLEDKYTYQFNSPYCMIRVINKRVAIYTGNGGTGQVVPLLNDNINIIEALALAGGVADRGDVSKIKVFRKVNGEQKIYQIDLSKLDGVKYTNFAMQSGDIIYIDAVPRTATEVLKVTQPYLQLLTSFIIIYRFLTTN